MRKELILGFAGSISLLLFYVLVMTISSGSWSATISQFRQLWYWMIILSVGFGIQIGLYFNIKYQISKSLPGTKTSVATSSITSGVSMIACCAHHLGDFLPIIGLSGAALFLTKYQIALIILGIGINTFGIVYMLRMIKKIKSSSIPSLSHV